MNVSPVEIVLHPFLRTKVRCLRRSLSLFVCNFGIIQHPHQPSRNWIKHTREELCVGAFAWNRSWSFVVAYCYYVVLWQSFSVFSRLMRFSCCGPKWSISRLHSDHCFARERNSYYMLFARWDECIGSEFDRITVSLCHVIVATRWAHSAEKALFYLQRKDENTVCPTISIESIWIIGVIVMESIFLSVLIAQRIGRLTSTW